MAKVSDETKTLLEQVIEDPVAYGLLQDKCKWEKMSLAAVLSEWGDPREWTDYKEAMKATSAYAQGWVDAIEAALYAIENLDTTGRFFIQPVAMEAIRNVTPPEESENQTNSALPS